MSGGCVVASPDVGVVGGVVAFDVVVVGGGVVVAVDVVGMTEGRGTGLGAVLCVAHSTSHSVVMCCAIRALTSFTSHPYLNTDQTTKVNR